MQHKSTGANVHSYDIESAYSEIEKKIKLGHGQNEGQNYLSWIFVHRETAWGLNNRPCGLTIQREYQLRNNQEYYYFRILDLCPTIVDIREHYPITEIDETLEIANRLGIKHPTKPVSNQPEVLTIEYFITIEEGLRRRYEAHLFRNASELEKRSEIELIEIIYQFLQRRNIPLKIATGIDPRSPIIKNLELFQQHYSLANQNLSETDIWNVTNILTSGVVRHQALRSLCSDCDTRLGLEPGKSLAVAYHLMARRYWKVDMTKSIDTGQPLQILEINLEQSNG
jgi:hypothetical protein